MKKGLCAVYVPHPADPRENVVFHCGANGEYRECRYSTGSHECGHMREGMGCASKMANSDACIRSISLLNGAILERVQGKS